MSTAGAERTGTREGRFAGVRVVDLRQQIGTEPRHSVAVFATQPRTVVSDCARQQRRAQPVLVRCLCTVNTTRIHTVTNISTPSFRTNPPPQLSRVTASRKGVHIRQHTKQQLLTCQKIEANFFLSWQIHLERSRVHN